jgi:putative membrane protein
MFETLITSAYGTIATRLAGWCGGWGGGYYGGHGFGMMGGYWPFGMLFMGIFWVAVIALVVWAIWRLAGGKRTAHATTETAESHLDILKRRLASGEISVDEFTRLKKAVSEIK